MRGRRSVVKHMPEMRVAPCTEDFNPPHEHTRIDRHANVLWGNRLPEAGPPSPRIELRLGVEQLRAAAGAPLDPLLSVVMVGSGESALGPLFPRHVVLLGRQLLLPFLIALDDLVHEHYLADIVLRRPRFLRGNPEHEC